MCQRCTSCSWYLAGLTSFGSINCGVAGTPGVYTNVLAYESWIRSHVPLQDSGSKLSCASSNVL